MIGLAFLFSSIIFASDYLFIESKFQGHKSWTKFSQKERLNIKNLLQTLSRSKTGKDLIKRANRKAKSYGKSLYDVIKEGEGSITDTTLIRRFSPSSPDKITYESRSKVFINRDLVQYDALLDLAHELTHFVYKDGFNPYVKDFNLTSFIKNTIEGKGGEVQAFINECKVLHELFPSKVRSRYSCKQIIDSKGTFSYKKGVEKFYSIGPFYSKLKHKFEKHGVAEKFNNLSSGDITFVSSAYALPYPVAAYKEFESVLTKVCENDKKRIAMLSTKKKGRSIASIKQDYLDKCSINF